MNILMVLSAKLIASELREHFGKVLPLMLPANEGYVIDRLYNKYRKKYDEIIIAVNEKKESIEQHVKYKNYNVRVIEVDKVVSVGYTIEYILNNIIDEGQINNLSILYGDTELTNTNLAGLNENIAFYSIVEESEPWTVFEEIDGDIVIIDKQEQDKECFNAFVGAFNFTDVFKLQKLLHEANKNICNVDSFYRAIKEYNTKSKIKFRLALDWEDLGHIDRYLKVRKDTEARYFNSIEIDSNTGILTKKSTDTKKFINEIKWYLKIPKNLEYLIPRIFEYSTTYNEAFIQMEYYSYPTLHNIYLYSEYNIAQWRKIFKVLFETLNRFKEFTYKVEKDKMKDILKNIYLDKTIDRLSLLRMDQRFKIFFEENVIINNKTYNNLEYYIKKLNDILEKNGIYELDMLNIIHGDYFFANILYDPKINMIKLIDPRGDFGGCGIYGDRRYELAKLAHSIDGKYDFIVKDLFDLTLQDNTIYYEIHTKERHDKITQLFLATIKNYEELRQIKLIEALLFLSMVPLHKDYFNRQVVMLCTGIVKLQQIIDEV